MSGWSRALTAAAFGLSAMGVGGCAFFEKPAAVEVLVRQELPPLKQRVTSLEGADGGQGRPHRPRQARGRD
jgi:hypothetical protein